MASNLISCDWFSFSLLVTSPYPQNLPTGFDVEELQGNNIFQKRFIYRCRGSKVLTCLAVPKSKILKKNLMLCEVGNRWLYDRMNLIAVLSSLFPSYVVNNISRVDICCDFVLDEEKKNIINKLADGSYYVGGKQLGCVFYEDKKNRTPYCLNFGSVESAVKWKLYDKTKEINATSKGCTKPWIKAAWRCAGLDISAVWRLEVSFHGEKFHDEMGSRMELDSMYNNYLLSVIFAEFYKYRFQVKERKHTRKGNDRMVPFLEINVSEQMLTRQREVVRGRYDDERDGLVLLNRLLRSYFESKNLSDGVKVNLHKMITTVVNEYGYGGYILEKWGVEWK